jgi:peptidoglycan/LPS O-acetylase OafA/YrhL
MKYRAEIDGLRTVAVIPVVLYHMGLSAFPGGFVGVDIFFVISGFLITSLIAQQYEAGSFSLKEFYVRRVRRLVPALVPVVAFSFWVAWTYLFPPEFTEFLQSVVGVFTYTSNFVFLIQADYFAEASKLKPLLHTWSLAIEEQFYLILPITLLTCLRIKGRTLALALFAICGAASLAACIYVTEIGNFDLAFFNSAFRFWELLAGSILALI